MVYMGMSCWILLVIVCWEVRQGNARQSGRCRGSQGVPGNEPQTARFMQLALVMRFEKQHYRRFFNFSSSQQDQINDLWQEPSSWLSNGVGDVRTFFVVQAMV